MVVDLTHERADADSTVVFVGGVFPADRETVDSAWQNIETTDTGITSTAEETGTVPTETNPSRSTWREAYGVHGAGFYFPSGFKDFGRDPAERK